jgi:putative intracellular protease/amidase
MRGRRAERPARSVRLFGDRSNLAWVPLDPETGGAGAGHPTNAELSIDVFDAIVVAGGQAPMFTFEGATELQRLFVAFFEVGKVAAALCHGVALLRYARLSGGELLARGRTVTGFANIEEDFADNAVWEMGALPRDRHLMPWRIEDEMRALGANYVQAGLWRDFAVRDGNLITGQQNFSGAATARLVIEALGG